MIVPRRGVLVAAGLWLVAAMAVVAWPALARAWWISGGVAGLVLLADALMVLVSKRPDVSRKLPGRFALNEPGEVEITLVGNRGRKEIMEVFDGIPPGALVTAMPWMGAIFPRKELKITHPVVIRERGVAIFGKIHVNQRSPLGFWQRRSLHGSAEEVKVYPNYEPVIRFSLLAMQHRDSPAGHVRRARPGSSRDFHQLRDYREGDPFSQIDWKASSRRQALISRDFQEQRDQTIVFLLDTGRRMRTLDGGLPQFDHVLNSVLLVAHVALKQGDAVAVKSFGGTDRWLPPMKGAGAMPVLLNHLYDYATTSEPSDFALAVEQLMARQRRRALVILLTNLRGEDEKELIPAMQTLRRKHLVLVASMREEAVGRAADATVQTFDDALRYLAADRYLQERREVIAALGVSGVLTLDATAAEFPMELAGRYSEIKAAGAI